MTNLRKNFAQVLKEGKIDINQEYQKLFKLYYTSYFREVQDNFTRFHFSGICLSLEEFNEKYGFVFEDKGDNVKVDELVRFAEYFYNMMYGLFNIGTYFGEPSPYFAMELIKKIMEEIGYIRTYEDEFTVFVEKSQASIAVAEILETPASYKVIFYNHHSLKGNLDEKRAILLQLASLLEPKRAQLAKSNKKLEDNVFLMFNKMQIRHNNKALQDKGKYNEVVAKMSDEELEEWYDETYQMCLLAFLELDNVERNKKVDELKQQIENARQRKVL